MREYIGLCIDGVKAGEVLCSISPHFLAIVPKRRLPSTSYHNSSAWGRELAEKQTYFYTRLCKIVFGERRCFGYWSINQDPNEIYILHNLTLLACKDQNQLRYLDKTEQE